ncbi:MAG TPA: ABC transporter ATP-binding protein [Chloroflexia bacterium]|nr:ABC transporter ATP-binding protein [Chloroflexia bacterium]
MINVYEAIYTENLSRDFKNVRAVNELDLNIQAGQIFGFLGPNGAGKTTTIHLLLGLLEPSTGSARVLGNDTRQASAKIREQTGVLLEHTGLYERLSAEDNLNFYGRVWGLPAAARQARARELLDQLGLWERRKEVVGKWSKGMKQKLAVARAIFHRPALIFLDEPTSGLDPVSASQLHQDLQTLVKQEGTTIFLTTHNLTEAEQLCQQIAVIRQGRLLAKGTPAELRANQSKPLVEVEGANFSPHLIVSLRECAEVAGVNLKNEVLSIELRRSNVSIAPLVKLIVDNGGQIEEIRKSRKSLEDVFLELVRQGQ